MKEPIHFNFSEDHKVLYASWFLQDKQCYIRSQKFSTEIIDVILVEDGFIVLTKPLATEMNIVKLSFSSQVSWTAQRGDLQDFTDKILHLYFGKDKKLYASTIKGHEYILDIETGKLIYRGETKDW
jgi:outer membrane protein assembly factor BamB